jgi:hypothetical protein
VVGTAVYTAAGLPNGLTINSTTGTISGTVSTEYSNGQTFPVTVTLTDGYDGATKTTSYTLTVAMPIAARAGQQTAYTTRVSDAFATVAPVFDNTVGTVTYTQTGKPSALSFSSSTGVLSGTPTATGTSTVVVTAKDSTGRTGTFTYTVNIQAAFTVTATTIVAFSDSPTISSTVPLTVTGAIGTLTYDYVGLPSGLTFNSSTGAVSGTIPSGLGVTTVTASVHDTFGDKSASLSMKVNLAVREHVYWRVIYPPSQTNEMYAYDIDGTRISIAGGGWLTDGNTTTGVNNTGNTTVNVYASSAVAVRKIMIQGYNANNAPSSFTVFFSDDNSTWYQVPAVVFSKSGVYGIGAW